MEKKIEKYLFIFLIFLLPTQLAYHFWPSWAYVYGFRVDLLAPAVYLTDVIVVFLLFQKPKLFKPYIKYFAALIVFATLNIIFSSSQPESLFRWLKVLEFTLFALYVSKQKLMKEGEIVKYLFYASAVVSVIGICQFIKNETIGGLFYWLGERSFNIGTPGIALVSLNGAEHLRAYSVFSHPNSLAGFLGVVLIVSLFSGQLKKNIINIISASLIVLCFVLTFSATAYSALLIALILMAASNNKFLFERLTFILLFSSILFSLILPFVSLSISKYYPHLNSNISQRFDLAYIAGEVIAKRFWLGTGPGTFIVNMPRFKGVYSYSWLLQPVHNIFLLVFSELGIFVLLITSFLFYKLITKTLKNKKYYLTALFIFIIITGLFDHYWLTLQQNQLLLSLLLGLSLL